MPVLQAVKSSLTPMVDGVPMEVGRSLERFASTKSVLRQDYSKVDRSAAYAARWVAKSLVASGLCRRALVQLSYAIGVAEPLSIFVETYGTSKLTSSQLVAIVRKNFDLRPGVLGTLLDVCMLIGSQGIGIGEADLSSYCFVWTFHKSVLSLGTTQGVGYLGEEGKRDDSTSSRFMPLLSR
jgi:hypothetical protein